MDSATIDFNSKQFLFAWHELCCGLSSSIGTFIPQRKAAATSIRNYQQKITGYKVSAWNWQVLPPLLVDNKPQLAFETTNQGIVHKLIEQTAALISTSLITSFGAVGYHLLHKPSEVGNQQSKSKTSLGFL